MTGVADCWTVIRCKWMRRFSVTLARRPSSFTCLLLTRLNTFSSLVLTFISKNVQPKTVQGVTPI